MTTSIRNVVLGSPNDRALGRFYADLLGWRVVREDWFVVAKDPNTVPRLAFDTETDYRPPRWQDPEHPQQVHLDLPARDLDAADELAVRLGGTRLQDTDEYRTYADPAGHPFCVYLDQTSGDSALSPFTGEIGRIVYDCFSPRALAAFYQQLLGMPVRTHDAERFVMIAREDGSLPMLAFQHAHIVPPRWPEPACPQQIHLDLQVDDGAVAQELALRLGAIPLPAMGGSCPVFADPAAHPFCLCSPGH
jgi:catechol 2,3-dioxygenase-like lactoylglutathione lyase family enzyme